MKKWWLVFLVIVLFSSFVVYSQTKPSGDPPAPFWSPRPSTAQEYIKGICDWGKSDTSVQAWCAWLTQHLEDVPVSYLSDYSGSTPSGTTPTPTACLSLGGTCKSGICSNYGSCSSLRGATDCSSGYSCCSGTCTSGASTTVNVKELRDTLIDSIRNYFTNLNNVRLTVNELKDLIITYFSTSGNTVDLSGTGHYSGERLIDIYNKAKGTTCIPDCTGKCGGVSDGCEGTCNAPCASGPVGSKTNPIPINIFYGGRSLIYHPSTATRGAVTGLAPNSKTYFRVDTAVTGKIVNKFYFIVKGFNNADLVYTVVPQSKTTGQDLEPEGRIKYGVNDAYDPVEDNKPYDFDSTRFLYAIENKGGGDVFDVEMWVQFMPYVVSGLPAPSGPLGSKTNPLKLNTPTPKYPTTRYATAASALNEGGLALAPGSKTYFVIDPLETKGISVSAFAIQVNTFNDAYTICRAILQDKITGNFITGGDNEVCRQSVGFKEIIYDNGKPYFVEIDNTRFIYAIENNLNPTGTITIYAEINPSLGTTPAPTPVPTPAPSGPPGSKTNPYKINKPTAKVSHGFIPENSQDDRGTFSISGGAKIYFEIDPVATADVSSGFFKLGANFLSGAGTICKLTQDKNTGAYSSESCFGSDGLIDIVPITSNTKYLYAIDNNLGGGYVFDVIQVSIPLF